MDTPIYNELFWETPESVVGFDLLLPSSLQGELRRHGLAGFTTGTPSNGL